MDTWAASESRQIEPKAGIDRYSIDIGLSARIVFAEGILLELPYAAKDCVVPAAPSWLRGALNHRGFVVPRIDVAVLLGLALPENDRRDVVVDIWPHAVAWQTFSEPQLLRLLPAEGHTELHDIPELLTDFVTKKWWNGSNLVLEIDHRALLAGLTRRAA